MYETMEPPLYETSATINFSNDRYVPSSEYIYRPFNCSRKVNPRMPQLRLNLRFYVKNIKHLISHSFVNTFV